MCYSRDYMSFEDQQKKAEEQANQDRRNETITKLREEAHKPGDKAKETTPAEDFAPAK
jgi:hypothetical protein